jgi:hypothetical protein
MVAPFRLWLGPSGVWRSDPPRQRVKAETVPVGATRSRLILVLRHLGLYRERIEARPRDEQRLANFLEALRLEGLKEEQRTARVSEERRLARLQEERETSRLIEERRAARILKDKLAYEAMNEEQKAAWRLEEQIVSWLTAEDDDYDRD